MRLLFNGSNAGEKLIGSRRVGDVGVVLFLVLVLDLVFYVKWDGFFLEFLWVNGQTSSLASLHSGVPEILDLVVCSSR